MKPLSLFLLLILISPFSFSQDKIVEVNLKKNHTILEMLSLGNMGFVVRTGEAAVGQRSKKDILIQYYDESCNRIWEKSIKENYPYQENKSFLVATENGSYVYFIETQDKIYQAKTHFITQIKKDGTEKKFEIKGKEEFGKNLQAAFCDDDYFYYLTTEDGNELNDRKKKNEKLILNRFSSLNFAHSRFTIDAPPITGEKAMTYWSYLGQKGSENLLLSKNIDRVSGKSSFRVVSFDQQGKVIKNRLIEVDLVDKFLRPGYHSQSPRKGFKNFTDLDVESKIVGHTTSGAQSSSPGSATNVTTYGTTDIITNGGFSQLTFDPVNNAFYVFGIFGPNPFHNMGSVYDGFYIFKFDMEGKNLWKLKQLASKELMGEGVFRVQGAPSERSISMKILPDQSLNLSIHFRKTIYTHEVSSTGSLLKERTKKNHFIDYDNSVLLTSKKLRSPQFIEENYSKMGKDINYFNALSQDGEYIIEGDIKASKFRILYFKNKP